MTYEEDKQFENILLKAFNGVDYHKYLGIVNVNCIKEAMKESINIYLNKAVEEAKSVRGDSCIVDPKSILKLKIN